MDFMCLWNGTRMLACLSPFSPPSARAINFKFHISRRLIVVDIHPLPLPLAGDVRRSIRRETWETIVFFVRRRVEEVLLRSMRCHSSWIWNIYYIPAGAWITTAPVTWHCIRRRSVEGRLALLQFINYFIRWEHQPRANSESLVRTFVASPPNARCARSPTVASATSINGMINKLCTSTRAPCGQ